MWIGDRNVISHVCCSYESQISRRNWFADFSKTWHLEEEQTVQCYTPGQAKNIYLCSPFLWWQRNYSSSAAASSWEVPWGHCWFGGKVTRGFSIGEDRMAVRAGWGVEAVAGGEQVEVSWWEVTAVRDRGSGMQGWAARSCRGSVGGQGMPTSPLLPWAWRGRAAPSG